jgi:hypothetical protein
MQKAESSRQTAAEFSAYCLLLTAFCPSKLVFVLILVKIFFFDQIEFDGIEAYDFQLDAAFFTINDLTFIRIGIDVNIGFTLGTRSDRHFAGSSVWFRLPHSALSARRSASI